MNIYPHQGMPSSLIAILAIMAGVSVANLYYCQPLLNMIGEDLNLSSFHVNLMPVCTRAMQNNQCIGRDCPFTTKNQEYEEN